jgi:hypothetical protein
MRIRRATYEWPQTELVLTRDGTSIEMFSSDLGADALVTIASELVPVPEGPPAI